MLLMKVNVCEKHQLCMAFSKPHQLSTSYHKKAHHSVSLEKQKTGLSFSIVYQIYTIRITKASDMCAYGRDEETTPSFAF